MPAGAGDTETSFLHVKLSVYIRGFLYVFQVLSFTWGAFPFTPSVEGMTRMRPFCQKTQTAVGGSLEEDHPLSRPLTLEPFF